MRVKGLPGLAHRRLLILLASGLVLCTFGLMWGLPNLFDFAQDSVVPNGALAQLGTSFEKVTTFRYPPFHFLVLRVCFLPARALLAIPGIRENHKVASTLFILTARLVSVAMALGVLALLRAIGRRLWDESAGAAAALLFILSPVTLYYARNANLDIPYVFWLAAALLVYVRILQERRRRDYLWLGILAALAVCTKDQAYGFILFMPLALLPALPPKRRDALACAALGALGFALPFALIHNLLFDFAGFWRHVKMILGPASEGWREVAFAPVGEARLLVETFLRLMDAWTPAGLALVVARNCGRMAPARKARPVDRHADPAGVLLRLLPDAHRLRVSALHAPDDAGAGAVCGTRRGLALAPALAGRRGEDS